MSNITIVLKHSLVHHVYAVDPETRVTVLDFDIEGAPSSELLNDVATGTHFLAASFDEMSQGERDTLALLLNPERLSDFMGADSASIGWSVEDVQRVRPDLNSQQCREVLKEVARCHDTTIGITWDTIADVAKNLYPE